MISNGNDAQIADTIYDAQNVETIYDIQLCFDAQILSCFPTFAIFGYHSTASNDECYYK